MVTLRWCCLRWESVLKPTSESGLRPTLGSGVRPTPLWLQFFCIVVVLNFRAKTELHNKILMNAKVIISGLFQNQKAEAVGCTTSFGPLGALSGVRNFRRSSTHHWPVEGASQSTPLLPWKGREAEVRQNPTSFLPPWRPPLSPLQRGQRQNSGRLRWYYATARSSERQNRERRHKQVWPLPDFIA